jgi:replicative DNA helicase
MNDRRDQAENEDQLNLVSSLLSGSLDPRTLKSLFDLVDASDLTLPEHQRLFAAVKDLHESGVYITSQVLEPELRRRGVLDQIGGRDELLVLASRGKSVWRAWEWHAERVVDSATKRRFRQLLQTALMDADSDEPIEQVSSRLEAELRGLSVRSQQDDFTTAGEAAQASIDAIQDAWKTNKQVGVKTGLEAIDVHCGGFQRGSLTVLAARPSVGKSCLGAEIAQRVAERSEAVMFASLEMSPKEMGDRFLSRLTGIPSDYLRDTTQLSAQHLDALVAAQQRLAKYPLRLWGTTGVSIAKLKAAARRMQASFGLSLLVVDYIGLVRGEGRDTRERVGDVSLQLKAIARELDLPVLALCQLNRDSEKFDKTTSSSIRRPTLAELRDSGAIEQDADSVWFIIRERDSQDCVLNIAKFRNGRTGDVQLLFDGEHSRVLDRPNTWTP